MALNLRVIFRPLCWTVGHLWEMYDRWSPRDGFYILIWQCERCDLSKRSKPEGW